MCVCVLIQSLEPPPPPPLNIPVFLIGYLGVDAIRETSRGQHVAQVSNRLASLEQDAQMDGDSFFIFLGRVYNNNVYR